MQATALGRYLLYGPDGNMPATALLDAVGLTGDARTEPPIGGCRTLPASCGWSASRPARSSASTRSAGSTQVAPRPRAGASRRAQGCAKFPEVEVNVTGTPFKGSSPTARVRGFLDDHIHLGAFEFLGGRFHCGRPWSPYGVTVALKDCADHYPNGAGAVVENFISTRQPGRHPQPGGLAELRRLAA